MKKVLLWIAKIFKIDLTKEIVITKINTVYVSLDKEINHDVIINGNLIVEGTLTVSKEITCHNINKTK